MVSPGGARGLNNQKTGPTTNIITGKTLHGPELSDPLAGGERSHEPGMCDCLREANNAPVPGSAPGYSAECIDFSGIRYDSFSGLIKSLPLHSTIIQPRRESPVKLCFAISRGRPLRGCFHYVLNVKQELRNPARMNSFRRAITVTGPVK